MLVLKKSALIIMTLLLSSGCAELLERRSFIDEMDNQQEDLFVAGKDFPTVGGDSGMAHRSEEDIVARTPTSDFEMANRAEDLSIMHELRSKEVALSPYQQSLYRVAEQYMDTPSEKIYFLNLSDEEKVEYLDTRSLRNYNSRSSREAHRGLASLQPTYSNTLNRGMSKDEVVHSWGRPARIDIAGNPSNENERWAFYGNGGVRYIYFESGRVEGWNVQ